MCRIERFKGMTGTKYKATYDDLNTKYGGKAVIAERKDLLQVLWSGTDVLRGKMDANEYKTYLLGLVFINICRIHILQKCMTFLRMKARIALKEQSVCIEEAMESDELFNGLFADVDLHSNRLGTGVQKQSATIVEVIKVLDGVDIIHTEGDVLGNAYEYLIGQYASETGKKAGEFYTPHGPVKIKWFIYT